VSINKSIFVTTRFSPHPPEAKGRCQAVTPWCPVQVGPSSTSLYTFWVSIFFRYILVPPMWTWKAWPSNFWRPSGVIIVTIHHQCCWVAWFAQE
jgi:hypothetical protein